MLAEALRDWLPSVLQTVQPWMSSADIQIGARWNVDLAKELETAKIGIVCVTPENQTAPWMLFEVGALSKVVEAQSVVPYLLNMRPSEVQGPLVQFQAAVTDRDDTYKLVSTINRALDSLALSDAGLEKFFDKWWPDLEAAIASIPEVVETELPPRPDREVLEEILDLIRQGTREHIERAASAEFAATIRQQDLMVMTHQILGPLNAVAASLSFAAHNTTGEAASDIENAQALVQDTLILSYGVSTALAMASGRTPALFPEEVNVQLEVRELATRLQRTNARADLVVLFKASDRFPKLYLDERSLESVLYSLIHNVTKYADNHSQVIYEFALTGPDARPVLTITSTGEPILPSERERIFERFGRGSHAEAGRHYTGVGLGLWVARQLMQQLGGDVAVELSVEHPRVTKFVVYFGSGIVI